MVSAAPAAGPNDMERLSSSADVAGHEIENKEGVDLDLEVSVVAAAAAAAVVTGVLSAAVSVDDAVLVVVCAPVSLPPFLSTPPFDDSGAETLPGETTPERDFLAGEEVGAVFFTGTMNMSPILFLFFLASSISIRKSPPLPASL